MMASAMVERVARELREFAKRNGSVVFGEDKNGWRSYVDDARRIIAAMHEPTELMIDATLGNMNEVDGPEICAEDWRRMIEAALTETS